MPEIKIKIGAAVDQSMRTVFKPLQQAAHEARAAIQKEFSQLNVDLKTGFAEQRRAAKKEFTGISEAGGDMSRQLERQRQQQTRTAEQESKREWAAYVREAKKAYAETQRAAKEHAAVIERFAERTSHRATRFFMPNLPIMSLAARGASEVLQGAGVDTSISGLMQRGVGIESAAVALSNRGHIEGAAGANGSVVQSSILAREARAAGKATAVNPEELLAAGHAFVGLTGDLALWRQIMPQVAARTKALGGSQEDAARAAGVFAAQVGDVPDKAKKVLDLVAVAGGQGKIGGVDFSDFAKYTAKAAAPAAQFVGDNAQNISKLTALAEIAKMHGGASSPAEAFTAVSSLANTLSKPARLKSISKLIGDTNGQFADSSHTKFKDPFELVKRMIVASKGSIDVLGAAIGDSRSMKAVRGLVGTYNDATGGKSDTASMNRGLEAMNAELKKFQGAILSNDEVSRALATQMGTTASKAELFNQQLETIVSTSATKLVPALEELAPKALWVADELSKIATWAAGNPWTAVAVAASAALSRAILESGIRSIIEKAIMSSVGAIGGGGGLGGVATGAGRLGKFVGAVSAGAAGGGLGYGLGELAGVDASGKRDLAGIGAATAAGAQIAGPVGAAIGAAVGGVGSLIDQVHGLYRVTDGFSDFGGKVAKAGTPEDYDKQHPLAAAAFRADQYGQNQRDPSLARNTELLSSLHAAVKELHNAIVTGTLKVNVQNQNQPKAPTAGDIVLPNF
jgi:hypothetical protein